MREEVSYPMMGKQIPFQLKDCQVHMFSEIKIKINGHTKHVHKL